MLFPSSPFTTPHPVISALSTNHHPSRTTKRPLKPPYAPRPSLTTSHSPRPADPYTACIPRFLPFSYARSPPKSRKSTQTCPNPQVHMSRTNTIHKYRTYISNLISPMDLFHTWYALPIQPAPDSRPAHPLSRPQMNHSISCIHTLHQFLTQMAGIHGRYSRTVSPFTPPFYGR